MQRQIRLILIHITLMDEPNNEQRVLTLILINNEKR